MSLARTFSKSLINNGLSPAVTEPFHRRRSDLERSADLRQSAVSFDQIHDKW